jgi:hypothetical protein
VRVGVVLRGARAGLDQEPEDEDEEDDERDEEQQLQQRTDTRLADTSSRPAGPTRQANARGRDSRLSRRVLLEEVELDVVVDVDDRA